MREFIIDDPRMAAQALQTLQECDAFVEQTCECEEAKHQPVTDMHQARVIEQLREFLDSLDSTQSVLVFQGDETELANTACLRWTAKVKRERGNRDA